MATPSPTLQRSSFDTGPLSWVIGEIRDALARASTALREAAGRSPEAQPTLLLHAKTHLHQAHGALQLVDVEGVGVYTGAAEAVLDGFKNGELPCTVDSVQVVLDAFGALGEYLDELLAGMPQQPARLFPYYRDMVERQGERKVHPSDLMPLDLSTLPGCAPVPGNWPATPRWAWPRSTRCRKASPWWMRSAASSIPTPPPTACWPALAR